MVEASIIYQEEVRSTTSAEIIPFPVTLIRETEEFENIAHEASSISRLYRHLQSWARRHRDRQQLRKELEGQPTSVIEDAGFSAREWTRETAKPFWAV